jgi:hypothetical protein
MLIVMVMRKILLSLVAFAGFAGCYVEDSYSAGPGYASAGYVAPAGYVEPEMVVVSPGVQVVYDYDYPVFFNAGFYWRYDGGIWYSSRFHTGGWARSYNVPSQVRGISRPESFAHYRPAGYVPRANGGYRAGNQNYRAGGNANYRGPVEQQRARNYQAGRPAAQQARPAPSSSRPTTTTTKRR